ncbi:von Willebrand factor type A domain-containing protein [Pedobacter endophyticus]|uniref:von Willebrand factor type A domain-containing protein n=2 Tax=Pedobacter endophyticus TaxID=2789740 RepID=A0A7S9Q0R1_9SPHI|nr:VWA domain-containing protein [Pedobacter endophyticus]QPH41868.1 von Willebrand factor type A domain-containing protein [Pedobacter endophyticus]
MKKLLLSLTALLILMSFKPGTTRLITGTVTDGNVALPGAVVATVQSKQMVTTNTNGEFSIKVTDQDTELRISHIGFVSQVVKIGKAKNYHVKLIADSRSLEELVVVGYAAQNRKVVTGAVSTVRGYAPMQGRVAGISIIGGYKPRIYAVPSQESYAKIAENAFHKAQSDPLSTFSIDVDAASYANVRRFVNGGALPPTDAVRIEEMINYFDYDYEQPKGDAPVNIITEIAAAPWNKEHRLVQIGLQAKTIPTDNLPASNLVFLIDVSGSMQDQNKLPLLISSFKLLTNQLRAKDKVAIVVYAGSSGVVLPATSGDEKTRIKDALDKLRAGGSTAGGEGIQLAYKIAGENFVKNGNNRVILATDGDFNVGANSDAEMQSLIEEKRKSGIFLTVLGYGMGNYKDSKMEILADKGNGNYAYIDNLSEARKVLVNEFGGTLFTVAKDVKLQIEFNPAKVQSYRLIGYENRLLDKEDFNDDKKDAGEIGSGHTVTALYEIIPVGAKDVLSGNVDELKYQKNSPSNGSFAGEMLTVKLRYKDPKGSISKLLTKGVTDNALGFGTTTDNFRFAAAVAEFGMILRNSSFKQNATFEQVITLAENAKGKDKEGYRSEFLSVVKSARLMAKDLLSIKDKPLINEKN